MLFVLLAVVLSFGCARVRVEAPKEAIKLDISMRLDIYQHVAKDIDDIESIVSGKQEKSKSGNNQSFLNYFLANAYAEDSLSPEVEKAALSRRDRRPELISWEEKGVIGENKSGLVEIRDNSKSNSALETLVTAENSDRMVIYQAVAKKNGTSVEEVEKMYAKRLQKDASYGTPIEVVNESSGKSAWDIKK